MPASERVMHPGTRTLVIAWMASSQRSETIAERLGAELLLLGRSGFRRPLTAPFQYPLMAARTVGAVLRGRPRAIVVVAPPFIAPLVVWAPARLVQSRLAIDVHSGALLDDRWRWSVPLLRWLARRSDLTIVTLPSLATDLRRSGIRALVMPDPIPSLTVEPERLGSSSDGTAREPRIVAICGWGDDEPIEALVSAATDAAWSLTITGRPRRRIALPASVRLTGFLEQSAFISLVAAADAVVVLTTREDTLLSGAWEAVALERPLILSGTEALRATFGDGPLYVEPDPHSIRDGIERVLRDPGSSQRIARLRSRFQAEDAERVRALRTALAIRSEGPRRSGSAR